MIKTDVPEDSTVQHAIRLFEVGLIIS